MRRDEKRGVFVGGAGALGAQAEVGDKAGAVEQAERGVGIADVYGQKHKRFSPTLSAPSRENPASL